MRRQNTERMADYLDSWLSLCIQNSDITGLSLAISSPETETFCNSYGLSKYETSTPLTLESSFDIASQTKMFTLAVVLLMHDSGMLDLYKPLNHYLPELLDKRFNKLKEVNIVDVITHRSGLPRNFSHGLSGNIFDALEITIQKDGMAFVPSYSSVGYRLLAEAIERASGLSFAQIIDKYIIDPLGLNNTHPTVGQAKSPTQGYGYLYQGKREHYFNVGTTHLDTGAVGMWSTPQDLCKFVSQFFRSSDSIFNPTHKLLLQAVHWGPSQDVGLIEFGLGLETRWMGSKRFFGHTGGGFGHMSATYFDPDTEIAFSCAINCRQLDVLEKATKSIAFLIDFLKPATHTMGYRNSPADLKTKFLSLTLFPTERNLSF